MKRWKRKLTNLRKESEKDCEIQKGVFGLEITTTQKCNFNCSYCFEKEFLPEENLLDINILTEKIDQLLDSEWFKSNYTGIKLILWGGEPTLNMPLCKDLMETYKDNKRVCFFIYTNGSTTEQMMDTYLRLKELPFVDPSLKKLTVQVSYDGNPVHDTFRKNKKGEPTSNIVKNAIKLLHLNGINFGLKSTLTWDNYSFILETWDDIKSLHDEYGSKIKYALTMDYYDVRFKENKDTIKESLIGLATKEVKFYREHGYFLSNIFRSNRPLCATGKNMACIDTNGEIYNCHGSVYSKCSDDLKHSNIFDKNFINTIQRNSVFYKNNDIEPEECQQCIAGSCLRCNVRKFEESKKETLLDRWYDYPVQDQLCEYYRMVGKVGAAIESILREK